VEVGYLEALCAIAVHETFAGIDADELRLRVQVYVCCSRSVLGLCAPQHCRFFAVLIIVFFMLLYD
jgi:hypothetical protein